MCSVRAPWLEHFHRSAQHTCGSRSPLSATCLCPAHTAIRTCTTNAWCMVCPVTNVCQDNTCACMIALKTPEHEGRHKFRKPTQHSHQPEWLENGVLKRTGCPNSPSAAGQQTTAKVGWHRCCCRPVAPARQRQALSKPGSRRISMDQASLLLVLHLMLRTIANTTNWHCDLHLPTQTKPFTNKTFHQCSPH